MVNEDKVIENYKNAMSRLETALEESGRNVQDVLVIGASKTMPLERILFVRDNTDVKIFGENRVQELLSKYKLLKPVHSHFIGHLQTNKVKDIIDKVEMIESVHSLKLANEISKQALAAKVQMDVLLEINIGNEETKSGFAPNAAENAVREIAKLPNIHIKGLMCIPPAADVPEDARKYFRNMYKLFLDIRGKNIDNSSMSFLSMGMSHDFDIAVSEGATLVRVGTSLFGKRNYNI